MDRVPRQREPTHEAKEGGPKNWMMLNTPNHDAQFLPTSLLFYHKGDKIWVKEKV